MAIKNENVFQAIWKIVQTLQGDQVETAIADALEIMLASVFADSGIIWLQDKNAGRTYGVISVGINNKFDGFTVENGQGIIGEGCESSEAITIYDTSKDKRFPGGKDEVTGIEVKNVLLMPMIFRGEHIGCIEIFNRNNDEEYSEDEITAVHSFAGLVALFMDENEYSYNPNPNNTVIMSLKGITKDFSSGAGVTRVLKGVDLDIYENELLVILGESGCGKSTLLNIIGGMDSPTTGQITLDGRDFSHPSEKELVKFRRDFIGFIFQAYNLMPNLTAIENVRFIAEKCKNSGNPAKAIEMVGLSSRANNYPSMMSGGQQQRVSIARAVVKNPKIILADEPTAALDFTTGQEVLALIEKLIAQKVTTVVMVTHNAEIAKMANRVIRVKDGKIVSIRRNSWPMHASDLAW